MHHITVLLREAVDALALHKDSVVIDATHGSGGHALAIVNELGPKGIYIGIDADSTALETSPLANKKTKPTTHLVLNNFSQIEKVISSFHITEVDAILADLGWRTDQFVAGGKGFSFSADEPLLMTYGDPKDYTFTAYDIVNSWQEENIADVLYGYAEERFSRRIAKAIVDARKKASILTATDLAKVIAEAVPAGYRNGRINPATKTFQALRIAVNDELGVLTRFIDSALACLKPGGRLAIITFHSLEDRIVKLRFRELAAQETVTLITKKPIAASIEELQANPRARSAKMRVLQKI